MEAMADRLEYKNDTSENNSGNMYRRQIRAASALSFESGASDDVPTPQGQHLQYFPTKETRTLRRLIPATWPEMLSYYRSYVTPTCKTQIVSMQYLRFNKFLWYYITTLFFKSLPHTYVQMFLASYSRDEHFFVGKMVPIVNGIIFMYILAAFSELMMYMDFLGFLLDYVINGVLKRNPWNRCDINHTAVIPPNARLQINCYTLNDFSMLFGNRRNTIQYFVFTYVSYSFKTSTNTALFLKEFFHISPVVYYLEREKNLYDLAKDQYVYTMFWYFLFLWFLLHLFHHQIFKRYVWKTHHIVQWITNVVYAIIFIHLFQDYFVGQLENKIVVPDTYVEDIFWGSDASMISESMTAPPIIHILNSRSNREIRASGDSSTIIISNGIYFILKGLLTYRMKKYCESIINVPINLVYGSPHTFFYYWPIYFSNFYFGDLYTIIFFTLHFIMELCTVAITFECLKEAILCEWRVAKQLFVTIYFLILGIIWFYVTFTYKLRLIIYTIMQITVASMEIIVVYLLYPLDRLIDDITFFTGVVPSRLRIMNLRLVPIYYAVKVYLMVSSNHYFYVYTYKQFVQRTLFTFWYIILVIALVLGICHAVFKYIFLQKKGWKSLIIPDMNWGPDYTVRQIRKQYDSQTYVRSQAPKVLSRYMIQKAEAQKYALNLNYDLDSTRSLTAASVQLSYEDEKKND